MPSFSRVTGERSTAGDIGIDVELLGSSEKMLQSDPFCAAPSLGWPCGESRRKTKGRGGIEDGLSKMTEIWKGIDPECSDEPQKNFLLCPELPIYIKRSRLSPGMSRSFTSLQHRAPAVSRTTMWVIAVLSPISDKVPVRCSCLIALPSSRREWTTT